MSKRRNWTHTYVCVPMSKSMLSKRVVSVTRPSAFTCVSKCFWLLPHMPVSFRELENRACIKNISKMLRTDIANEGSWCERKVAHTVTPISADNKCNPFWGRRVIDQVLQSIAFVFFGVWRCVVGYSFMLRHLREVLIGNRNYKNAFGRKCLN